jgi:hypothetical protein
VPLFGVQAIFYRYFLEEDNEEGLMASRETTYVLEPGNAKAAEAERALYSEARKLSKLLDLGNVPSSFNEFEGFLKGPVTRARMRSTLKTQETAIGMVRNIKALLDELVGVERMRGTLDTVPEENAVKKLQLKQQAVHLRRQIAEDERAMREIQNPGPSHARPDDNIIIGNEIKREREP